MLIEVIKSKIHRVKVTDADLSYIGSITIDRDLIDAANFVVGEKVQVVNINNGERLETYIIEGKRASGEITSMDLQPEKLKKETSSSLSGMLKWNLKRPKNLSLL